MDEFDREEEFAEHPTAQLAQDKFFFVDDLMLVCDIQESSRGYTEMTAHQRVKGMMWARSMERSANQLAWWHIHPVTGWSSTDVNTLRQRVHETGLAEVLSTFSFVLTPHAIRARWDQSGPNEDPYEFVCRKDPETLVTTEACTTCPFLAGCFGLNLLELEAEAQRILEGYYDQS